MCVCVTERWTDILLYVKNVSEKVTDDELKEVFTDCEDIVVSKADSRGRGKDEKKTKSVVLTYAVESVELMIHTVCPEKKRPTCFW